MAEEIRRLLEEVRTGRLSRREFLNQAIALAGSLAAASAILETLDPAPVWAAQVPETDPGILTHNVTYDGKAGPVWGYLARPVKTGKYPGVVVIHENQGLTTHFASQFCIVWILGCKFLL